MSILKLLKQKSKSVYVDLEKFDNQTITFINPYSYLFLRKNKELFSKIDIIFLDGFLMVLLMKIVSRHVKRYSFDMTSLAPKVFHEAINKDKSVFFLGSKQNEIEGFVKQIRIKYKKLNIVGYENGYFIDESEKNEMIKKIVKLNPKVLIVGTGTPLQEELLLDIKSKGWKGTGFTCGGFFHQTASKINYYPSLIDKLNLRWLYRIYDEPKLFKRYFFEYPKSLAFFIFDLIKFYLNISK